ncbi:MAG: hypothetical protein JNL82_00855 [Myxococcales bacterium]|nr:hypothetical protein [Myxococcales bacterium]
MTRLGIVVDLAVGVDEAKKRMWMVHGDALREREGAPCAVLVFAVTADLAAWACAQERPQIWTPSTKPGHRWSRTSGSDA